MNRESARAASSQVCCEIGATRLRAKRFGEVSPKPEGRRRKRQKVRAEGARPYGIEHS